MNVQRVLQNLRNRWYAWIQNKPISQVYHERLLKSLYAKNSTATSVFDFIGTHEELKALVPWKTLHYTKSSTTSKAQIQTIISCVHTERPPCTPTFNQILKNQDSFGLTEADWQSIREGKIPFDI